MHFTEVVRRHLGWCPEGQRQNCTALIQPDGVVQNPSGSSSFKASALDWLGLFRNQMLILAIWFSVVGYLLLITLGNTNVTLFLWGLLAGLLLSAFLGFRFWKTMNEVLESGAVFLATLYDKTTIFITMLVFLIPLIVSVSTSPVTNMMTWNAVTAGFIFILFWAQLVVVWLWETRVNRHLQSDGLMLSLAREADHVHH
jgi:hypothetical protein